MFQIPWVTLYMANIILKNPPNARRKKIEGNVILTSVIREDGNLGRIEILQSPGAVFGFDEEVIKAAQQWRFKPATKNGNPIAVKFTVVVKFSLAEYFL